MTIKTFKNRYIANGQRVSAFWNLHKDVFSVQGNINEDGKKRKLTLGHGNHIVIADVEFKVSEAGRQRVLKEKVKNVHAYVRGKFVQTGNFESYDTSKMRQAYYNPYKQDCFTDRETGEKLERADLVLLVDKKIYYLQ